MVVRETYSFLIRKRGTINTVIFAAERKGKEISHLYGKLLITLVLRSSGPSWKLLLIHQPKLKPMIWLGYKLLVKDYENLV